MYSISFRIIYALSNAGADPNVTNGKGNTPLHEALSRGLTDCGFDLIQVFNLTKLFNISFKKQTSLELETGVRNNMIEGFDGKCRKCLTIFPSKNPDTTFHGERVVSP